jgi:hypothetical protein
LWYPAALTRFVRSRTHSHTGSLVPRAPSTPALRRRWAAEIGALAGIGLLAGVKLWSLITPWPGPDEFLGGDFGLAVEPYFYHLLKRSTIPLWDPTLGTGAPFFGAGTHNPMYVQAHLHLLYPLNLLWLGLAEQSYFIPHAILQYHHVFHYMLAGPSPTPMGAPSA